VQHSKNLGPQHRPPYIWRCRGRMLRNQDLEGRCGTETRQDQEPCQEMRTGGQDKGREVERLPAGHSRLTRIGGGCRTVAGEAVTSKAQHVAIEDGRQDQRQGSQAENVSVPVLCGP